MCLEKWWCYFVRRHQIMAETLLEYFYVPIHQWLNETLHYSYNDPKYVNVFSVKFKPSKDLFSKLLQDLSVDFFNSWNTNGSHYKIRSLDVWGATRHGPYRSTLSPVLTSHYFFLRDTRRYHKYYLRSRARRNLDKVYTNCKPFWLLITNLNIRLDILL